MIRNGIIYYYLLSICLAHSVLCVSQFLVIECFKLFSPSFINFLILLFVVSLEIATCVLGKFAFCQFWLTCLLPFLGHCCYVVHIFKTSKTTVPVPLDVLTYLHFSIALHIHRLFIHRLPFDNIFIFT